MTRLRQFLLFLGQEPSDDQLDSLFSRSDDVSVELDPGSGEAWVAFDREAPTLVDAVVSGVRDLDNEGIVALRVRDDDDIVTLGLIGQRVGRSEDAVRRWANGETGPGGFPAPVFAHPRRPCYLWSQVAPWVRAHYGHKTDDTAAPLRAVNLVLELRALAPAVERIGAIRTLLPGS